MSDSSKFQIKRFFPSQLPTISRKTSVSAEWVTQHVQFLRVVDGDTLVVRSTAESSERLRVRLMYIDAPELAQAFGANSTRQLRRKLRSMDSPDLRLRVRAHDNYGRTLAEVFSGSLNVNYWLVANGLAVCYKRRCPRRYKDAMRAARERRLGLWSVAERINPWTWRRRHPRDHRQL